MQRIISKTLKRFPNGKAPCIDSLTLLFYTCTLILMQVVRIFYVSWHLIVRNRCKICKNNCISCRVICFVRESKDLYLSQQYKYWIKNKTKTTKALLRLKKLLPQIIHVD